MGYWYDYGIELEQYMKLQVLVTTMNAHDFSVVVQMNLKDVDVIIANQTDFCGYEEKSFPDWNVHAAMISTNTKGASLNRNIAMAYADADVIIYADDDLVFVDGFQKTILQSFEKHPEADAIKFDCKSTDPARPLWYKAPAGFQKASFFTLMSAGVPAMAIRRERLEKCDIQFPNSIGPGRTYNFGEDSCFLKQLLLSRLGVYLSPELVAHVNRESSTWFTGYHEDYFLTLGYVYAKNYGCLALPIVLRRLLKLRLVQENSYSFSEMKALAKRGMRIYRS